MLESIQNFIDGFETAITFIIDIFSFIASFFTSIFILLSALPPFIYSTLLIFVTAFIGIVIFKIVRG